MSLPRSTHALFLLSHAVDQPPCLMPAPRHRTCPDSPYSPTHACSFQQPRPFPMPNHARQTPCFCPGHTATEPSQACLVVRSPLHSTCSLRQHSTADLIPHASTYNTQLPCMPHACLCDQTCAHDAQQPFYAPGCLPRQLQRSQTHLAHQLACPFLLHTCPCSEPAVTISPNLN